MTKRHYHGTPDDVSNKLANSSIAGDELSISDLPNEILSKIFISTPNLTLKEIFSTCCLVCKRWRCIIQSDVFLSEVVQMEFDQDAASLFLSKPKSIQQLREYLDSSPFFSRTGFVLDATSPKYNLQIPACRISSIEHLISTLQSMGGDAEWRSQSHCLVNGGFCNHYWYWLLNFDKLAEGFPEIINLLSFPFVIGGNGVGVTSTSTLYLLDKDLKLIEEPIEQDSGFKSLPICWTVKSYPPGLCYVAFEIYDDFSGNEDMPIRFLWPSQINCYERKLFIAAMNRRYGIKRKTNNHLCVGGDGFNDDDSIFSMSSSCSGDNEDDGYDNNNRDARNFVEFKRCFQRQSSSETSTGESENEFVSMG